MKQSRVGLMSTSLLAASGEPSLERKILGTLVDGDMLLFPLYESTRFVLTYLALAAAVASCELAGPRRSARVGRETEKTRQQPACSITSSSPVLGPVPD
jgi:hypothetical protein